MELLDDPGIGTLPTLLANTNHACYKCGLFRSREVRLQRCGGCKRVSYCGSECQEADWRSRHSKVCKALKHVEKKYGKDIDVLTTLQASDERERLNIRLERISNFGFSGFQEKLGRLPTLEERNLIVFEPRCLACGRSETVLRIQASSRGTTNHPTLLHPCPNCQLAFYCSEAHKNLVIHEHQQIPSPGGQSQCTLNELAYQDAKFVHLMNGANRGEFKWAPERTKSAWISLRGLDWDDFRADVAQSWPPQISPQVFRSMTEGLSMPMTILWALERLNDNDSWTRKEILNIHVIGADLKEIDHSQIFEEIMHRLPEVKVLKLDFIGPELGAICAEVINTTMTTCPDCSLRRRNRVQNCYPMEYQRFIDRPGSSSFKPDLAVAFNSGASEDGAEDSWLEVMRILVRRGIPTVFTSYNENEARQEAQMLQAAGATLHPELGPKRNVWGSVVLRLEPNAVTGFYGSNAWLAGGFR